MAQTADELRKAQIEEWNQFVAVEAIDIDGVRAFNPGDPVPAGHVGRVVDETQVAKRNTKAAKAAVETPADSAQGA